jgi:formate dehydrogenase assembly factor FdhD
MNEGLQHIKINKLKNGETHEVEDVVAVEAPLEIQIQHFTEGTRLFVYRRAANKL